MMSHSGENQAEPGWSRFPAGCPQDKLLKGPDSSFSAELQGGNSGKSAVCWQWTRARHASGVRCLTVTLSSQPEALIYDATLQLAISFV